MGYEDRDWFRDEHAKKNGLVYDKATGRYSPAPRRLYARIYLFISRAGTGQMRFPAALFWVGVALILFAAYKLLRFIS